MGTGGKPWKAPQFIYEEVTVTITDEEVVVLMQYSDGSEDVTRLPRKTK